MRWLKTTQISLLIFRIAEENSLEGRYIAVLDYCFDASRLRAAFAAGLAWAEQQLQSWSAAWLANGAAHGSVIMIGSMAGGTMLPFQMVSLILPCLSQQS